MVLKMSRSLAVPAAPAFRARRVSNVKGRFQGVYDEHAAFVVRSLRRLGIPPCDLDDAAQEAFLVVHRKLDDFEGRSSMKTWLFGICLRVAADVRKRGQRKKETTLDEAPERVDEGHHPFQNVAIQQARLQLEQLLDNLDPDKRAVFVLFELEEWPMNDIADAMGCPLQTAYARLYAARKTVESLMQQRQNGGSGFASKSR